MTFEVGKEDFSHLLGNIIGPRYHRALFDGKFLSLGYGSFGNLHLAFDLEMGAFVALKNFPRNSTEHDAGTAVCPSDILKEGVVAGSLDHRSLVLGRHYYVEDIDSPANHIIFGLCGFGSHENGQGFGYRSGHAHNNNQRIPLYHLRHCLGIAVSICEATRYLHDNHIIHRDIKLSSTPFLTHLLRIKKSNKICTRRVSKGWWGAVINRINSETLIVSRCC